MSSGYFALHRPAVILLLALAHFVYATPAIRKNTTAPCMIDTPGKGTSTLSGPWQFHPGDDLTWASPMFDSSDWQLLSADRSWGEQGHAQLTGIAWYRCSIELVQDPGTPQVFSLLVPKIYDSYEVYWNGTLIGHNGKLPPRPVWYISQPVQSFLLGPAQPGILAIRVWRHPLLSDDSGELGGFNTAPLIGGPEAIETAKAEYEFQWLRSRQLHFDANLLCAAIAFLSFMLWVGVRNRWVLLWAAGFAMAQPAILLLLNAHMAIPYPLAMGAAQPLYSVQDISLWFLLLWLLSLREDRAFYRVTQIFASVHMVIGVLEGALVALSSNPQWTAPAQASDAALTIISILFETFPLVLVGYAVIRNRQFDSASWLVAILAFLDGMLIFFNNAVKQGRQFTGWSIATKIDLPMFFLDGNGISLSTLAGALLLVAIVYGVYDNVREDHLRQAALERDKMELQLASNRMRHHAEHDGLTGLLNRRMIVERLNEEMVRSVREQTPLSVILADVDHFKKVNDTFGHLAGDLVLREIGSVFSRALRPYDCVGRYGGEEFLIILSNCETESALVRGEQLRAVVQSTQIRDGETLLQVTASFGVATVLPSHAEAEKVIRAADTALYRAKSRGRNCVMQAEMDASTCKN